MPRDTLTALPLLARTDRAWPIHDTPLPGRPCPSSPCPAAPDLAGRWPPRPAEETGLATARTTRPDLAVPCRCCPDLPNHDAPDHTEPPKPGLDLTANHDSTNRAITRTAGPRP